MEMKSEFPRSCTERSAGLGSVALEACSLFTGVGLRSLHSLETDNSTLARKDPPASNLLLLRPAHCSLALKDPPDSDLLLLRPPHCSLALVRRLSNRFLKHRSLHSLESDNLTLARKDPPDSDLLLLRPAHCSLALV
ncbi:hypothetical protein J6590_040180 [Homalodisca vitripennis]|nr:hypothetical protein J6590_040180 [Homalodisca vitripennis]